MPDWFSKFGRELKRPWSAPAEDRRLGESLAWLELAVQLVILAVALITLTTIFRSSLTRSVFGIAAAAAGLLGATILVVRAAKAIPASAPDRGRKRYEYRQHVGDLTHLDRVVVEGRRAIGDAHPDRAAIVKRLKENPGV